MLYNTYWVRFNRAGFSQSQAVDNSLGLFAAARDAGVERIVHISIANPSLRSRYDYYRGKAEIERGLQASGVPHSILRPTALFGGPEILLNNIAWMLRRFPVFGIVGGGEYRIRPIHVEDLADLAIASAQRTGNETLDAVGPESFTFRELVRTIGEAIGHRRPLVTMPKPLALLFVKLLGVWLRDTVLTRQEIEALSDDLLHTDADATGSRRFSEWLRQHHREFGQHYASELARRRDRTTAYTDL